MTPLLAPALALVCAWSQPHCAQLQRVPIVQGTNTVTVGAITYFQPPAATYWVNRQPVRVTLDPQLDGAPYVAAALAHESTEMLEGWPANGHDCGGYDGYSGEQQFAAWFSATFGPPDLSTADSVESTVWRTAQPDWQAPAC